MRSNILLWAVLISFAGCASRPSRTGERLIAADPSAVTVDVAGRDFPSLFQAWKPLTISGVADPMASLSRHDLVWQGIGAWGLKCADDKSIALCEAFSDQSVAAALRLRAQLKQANPHILILAEIRYHDAASGYLPDDSPWWKRDSNGRRLPKTNGTSTTNYFLLDFSNSDFQNRVALLCQMVLATGAVDGCMFDWWNNETPAHTALIEKVRSAVGEAGILIANVNGTQPKRSASLLNGIYMEGFGASFFNNWETAKANLLWAKDHLRPPKITALDAWGVIDSDDKTMRFPLTISLVFSDGYFLWGDQFHAHIWHAFWKRTLGHATEPVVTAASADGSYQRAYEHGTVVLNPPTHSQMTLRFPEPRRRASTGDVATQHLLASGDGDFFLKDE